jgi:hypothetical protein
MSVADRFRWAQRELRSQRLRKSWTSQDFSFLIGMTITVCLMLLEAAFWFRGLPGPKVSSRMAAAALFVLPLNGLLISHLLASRAPRAGPAWRRLLRFLLASLPLAGWLLLVVSPQEPVRAEAPVHGPDLTVAVSERGTGRWLDGFFRSGAGQLWLVIGPLLPVFLWTSWLTGEGPRGHSTMILAVCGSLHLAAAGCMRQYFAGARLKIQARGWRAAGFRSLPVFWLLPMPGPFLGLLVSLFLVDESRETSTLTWSAYARQTTARRLPLWIGMQESLGPRPTPAARTGEADLRRLALFRLKALLLATETAALAEALARLPAFDRGLWIAGCTAATLAAVGLLAHGALSIARLLRKANVSWLPMARYLLITQSAVASGVLLGLLLASGRSREAGLFLALFSALCAAIAFVFYLPAPLGNPQGGRNDVRDAVVWPLLFLSLAAFGVLLLDPAHGAFRLHLFRLALFASPVASLALGLSFTRWLLHPFSLHDLRDRRLPARLRATLAILALSAVAPLGGLFIPFWLWCLSSDQMLSFLGISGPVEAPRLGHRSSAPSSSRRSSIAGRR